MDEQERLAREVYNKLIGVKDWFSFWQGWQAALKNHEYLIGRPGATVVFPANAS